jgi:hypothetical protein
MALLFGKCCGTRIAQATQKSIYESAQMEQVAEPGERCDRWLLGWGRPGRHLEISPLGGDQGAAAVGQHEQQV